MRRRGKKMDDDDYVEEPEEEEEEEEELEEFTSTTQRRTRDETLSQAGKRWADHSADTLQWLRDNFVLGDSGSIPKAEVYDVYVAHCDGEPLSASGFGRLVHKAFPGIKTIRRVAAGITCYQYQHLLYCPTERTKLNLQQPQHLQHPQQHSQQPQRSPPRQQPQHVKQELHSLLSEVMEATAYNNSHNPYPQFSLLDPPSVYPATSTTSPTFLCTTSTSPLGSPVKPHLSPRRSTYPPSTDRKRKHEDDLKTEGLLVSNISTYLPARKKEKIEGNSVVKQEVQDEEEAFLGFLARKEDRGFEEDVGGEGQQQLQEEIFEVVKKMFRRWYEGFYTKVIASVPPASDEDLRQSVEEFWKMEDNKEFKYLIGTAWGRQMILETEEEELNFLAERLQSNPNQLPPHAHKRQLMQVAGGLPVWVQSVTLKTVDREFLVIHGQVLQRFSKRMCT